MISPKCTPSMPSWCTTGINTGTRISMDAVGSRKQPTNSISRFASSKKTHGLCVNDKTQAAKESVTLVTVRSQPKIDAAATMNMTVAVVSMVSIDTLMSIFHDSVRYQTMPRNSAQTQAAMAPSVGVKMPLVMPPTSRTGVIIGSTASNRNFQSAANSSNNPTATARLKEAPSWIAPQIATGNTTTMRNSSVALP